MPIGGYDRNDTKLLGNDESYCADVLLQSGIRRLQTSAAVTIEEIFGKDPIADSYFKITNAGAVNDTVRVQVASTTHDSSAPDRDFTAVDLTYTLVAGDVGDEIQLRDNIIIYLNTQSSFTNGPGSGGGLKAQPVKDNPIVHITSRYKGDDSERPNVGDFAVTTTGTTTVQVGWSDFIQRAKPSSLARDPESPHNLGILGISGTVSVLPGAIGSRYFEYFKYSTSSDMRVDGSSTPVVFTIPISTTDDIFISQIRLFGGGNGIKFGQFLAKNVPLTNGIKVEVKSDDQYKQFPLIKSTEDFKNLFSFPSGNDFRIDVQSGADQIISIFKPDVSSVLRKLGTFSTDDYVKITIQDDLTSGVSQLEAISEGFTKEV